MGSMPSMKIAQGMPMTKETDARVSYATKIVSVSLGSAMIMTNGARKHAANRMIAPQLPSVTSGDVLASNVFITVNAIAYIVIKKSANRLDSAV